jgi:hypothetical protein
VTTAPPSPFTSIAACWLGSATVPVGSVPIKLPWIV